MNDDLMRIRAGKATDWPPGRRRPAPATEYHPAIGQEAIVRTVGELRHYLEALPAEWLVEGLGGANALLLEALPGWHADPPLVVVEPVTLDNAGRRL